MAAAGYKPNAGSLVSQMAAAGHTPLVAPTAPPAPIEGDQVTNKGTLGNFVSNVAGAGKALLNTFTGSEQAAGQDITAALPGSVTGVDMVNKANQASNQSDIAFVQAMHARQQAGQALTAQQQQIYNSILNNHAQQTTAADLTPALNKSNLQVAGDFAGVAADVASAGTYSKAGLIGDKALTTGLTNGTPTAITAADTAIQGGKKLLTSTPEQIAAKQAAKVAEDVAPKLTARETADALASRGGTKSGILGTIKLNTDPAVQRIADTVQKYVPDFASKKSLVEKVGAVRQATDGIAQQLKQDVIASGKDRIYSFKELQSTLDKLPKSPTLVGDVEKSYERVVGKAMEIARSNGGKVSDLFQSRKEFDDYLRQAIPNLYSSDTLTPLRQAIRGVRNAMTDFTAERLPEDVALHDRLTAQSRLLDAIENMSAKASSGKAKEIGTNTLERAGSFVKNHPVLGGFGGIAAYEAAKKLPIVGDVLP